MKKEALDSSGRRGEDGAVSVNSRPNTLPVAGGTAIDDGAWYTRHYACKASRCASPYWGVNTSR